MHTALARLLHRSYAAEDMHGLRAEAASGREAPLPALPHGSSSDALLGEDT